MKKAQSLAPITGEKLSPIQQKKLVLDDQQAYNDLAIHHNSLVDHVNRFCR